MVPGFQLTALSGRAGRTKGPAHPGRSLLVGVKLEEGDVVLRAGFGVVVGAASRVVGLGVGKAWGAEARGGRTGGFAILIRLASVAGGGGSRRGRRERGDGQ